MSGAAVVARPGGPRSARCARSTACPSTSRRARSALGLVGESGSGKTTIGRAVLRLVRPAAGTVSFAGRDVARLRGRELKSFRRAAQIVFQDPDNSLDPRMRVGAALAEALRRARRRPAGAGGRARRRRCWREVGLDAGHRPALPASAVRRAAPARRDRPGAQRGAAAARARRADERARRHRAGAHPLADRPAARRAPPRVPADLAQPRRRRASCASRPSCCTSAGSSSRGPTGRLLAAPAHPYTQALRSAVPELDLAAQRPRVVVSEPPPNPAGPPPGCVFHPRCPLAVEVCRTDVPPLRAVAPGRLAACHFAEDVLAGTGRAELLVNPSAPAAPPAPPTG